MHNIKHNYINYTVSEAVFNTASTSIIIYSKERTAYSLRQASAETEEKKRLQ